MAKPSQTQKKEKNEKNRARKKRTFYNRLAMGLLLILLLVGIVYSIRSIKKVDLSDPGNRPFRGNGSARVIISEFSDFQCPACRAAEPNLKQLLLDYPGKIKFVFYNYPLTVNHPWAMMAGEAAQCAGDQEKFWPYHDLLYDRQDIWAKDSSPGILLKKYAVELGLNPERFNVCLDTRKKKAVMEEDLSIGDALQIQSTPTIFINQERIIGGFKLDELKKAAEAEIILHP